MLPLVWSRVLLPTDTPGSLPLPAESISVRRGKGGNRGGSRLFHRARLHRCKEQGGAAAWAEETTQILPASLRAPPGGACSRASKKRFLAGSVFGSPEVHDDLGGEALLKVGADFLGGGSFLVPKLGRRLPVFLGADHEFAAVVTHGISLHRYRWDCTVGVFS